MCMLLVMIRTFPLLAALTLSACASGSAPTCDEGRLSCVPGSIEADERGIHGMWAAVCGDRYELSCSPFADRFDVERRTLPTCDPEPTCADGPAECVLVTCDGTIHVGAGGRVSP